MIDPIGSFDQVKQNVILYLRTAFGTRFDAIEAERTRLLMEENVLCKDPWIEPLPKYQSSGKKISDLVANDLPNLSEQELELVKSLVSCGLFGNERQIYYHQLEMLQKALSGKNCIITAGTGSGKTEAFLLPLFAYLAKESKSWTTPSAPEPHTGDWWSNSSHQQFCYSQKNSYRVSQRNNEKREAALRAIVLYPMNALVEDQLIRLRKSLDSDAARAWFSSQGQGNKIYFGRYYGHTPIPGHEKSVSSSGKAQKWNYDKLEKLAKRLKEIEKDANAAAKKSSEVQASDQDLSDVIKYSFPRLDGSEMRCRWDMQDHPPDILITNFSMLSIMLMRDEDSPIFEKTRAWLKGDSNRVFHLVIDELHMYRGTSGTEVAYLIRLLLSRLGLKPGDSQLRILGSSASLVKGKGESNAFIKDFFGLTDSDFEIIDGKLERPKTLETQDPLPTAPFINLAQITDKTDEPCLTAIAKALGYIGSSKGKQALQEWIASPEVNISSRIFKACSSVGQTRAVPIDEFGDNLFGVQTNKEARRQAVKGFLIARGLSESSALPAFRLHWFFRNIEGLWAACKPAIENGSPVGELFFQPRILNVTMDSRVTRIALLRKLRGSLPWR